MSNIFREQTQEEFDAEMWEALAQIERGEVYTIEEVEAELEEKFAIKGI